MIHRLLNLMCLGVICSFSFAANAQTLTDYEHGHVFRQLQQRGWTMDPHPAKKRIAFVEIYRYPVFVEFESLPLLPNRLHVLSKEGFVRQELLTKEGDEFSWSNLNESVRNLRRLGVFSLVAAVPVLTKEPDTVGIFLVTRDLWSLRLESAFQLTGGVIDRLQMQLTERNLFGRGIQALVRYNLQPLYYSTGALFSNRRMLGKPYTLTLSSDVFFDRETGNYQGYSVGVYAGKPIFAMNDRWSFGISASRGEGVVRQEQMGQRIYWDDEETPEAEAVPRSWAYTSYDIALSVDAQFRHANIYRIGGGLSVSSYQVSEVSSPELFALSAVSRNRFREEVLPESLVLAYPQIRFSFYRDRFFTFKNLSSYALSEELQLGASGGAYAQFPTRTFGSSQDLVIAGSRLIYREKFMHDGLAEVAVSGVSRFRFEENRWTDMTFLSRFRAATPALNWGRVVSRFDWVGQGLQVTADPLSLGGDNGIRGYSSQRFLSFGGHRIRGNLELRTLPVRWGPFYGGGVVFYDGGALYGGSQDSGYIHAVGLGARGVFPQASSFPYRLDFGVPLDGSGFMLMLKGGTLTMETNQAVPITPRDDLLYSSGVGGLSNQP